MIIPVLVLAVVAPAFSQVNRPPTVGPPRPPPAGPISSGAMPGKPEIVPLLTDARPGTLPSLYGQATTYRINERGDFAFISGRSSGLFLRRSGEATIRLLQRGDPVPGFPESRCDLLSGVLINDAGLVVFDADYMLAQGGLAQHAIYAYDQAGFRLIAHTRAIAPGTRDAMYGRTMTLGGVNDKGDVAFTASLTPFSGLGTERTTLFIAPAVGAPVRIAGPGDDAPGTDGGKLNQIQLRGLNAAGEALFQAAIDGGLCGYGLFAGSVARRVRKIVAHNDSWGDGESFNLSAGVGPAYLNAAGHVAFGVTSEAGSIWTHSPSPAAGFVPVVIGQATSAPDPLEGHMMAQPTLRAFNDAGEVAFTATVPSLDRRNILVRSWPGNTGHELKLVAAQGYDLAGSDLRFGWQFRAFSLSNEGVLTFFNGVDPFAGTWRALFQHVRDADPFNVRIIVREGDQAPFTDKPTFGLLNTTITDTLPDGSVMFLADIRGGSAFSGVFLKTAGGAPALALMSTVETMPAGARLSVRPFRLGAAGSFVAFCAEMAGGQSALYLHDMSTGRTARVIGDGDLAPDPWGGMGMVRLASPSMPAVNRNGQLAFLVRHIGTSYYGVHSIFLGDMNGTLRRIVTVADTYEGSTIYSIAFSTAPPRRLNDLGQVVFTASLFRDGNLANLIPAVFVGAPGASGAPLRRVAIGGDVADAGRTFASFSGSQSINNNGTVAFHAWVQDGGGSQVGGLFIRTPTPENKPVKVALGRDPSPSGGSFPQNIADTFAFNDRGEAAFMTPLVGGPGGGVFVGTTSGLTAVALNGDPAPAGGHFAIDTQVPSLDLNDAGDIAFRSSLTGGSADSGAFVLRKSEGALRTVLLQGQPAPGTLGEFSTLSVSFNGYPSESLVLGPSGDVLVSGPFQFAGNYSFGTWRFRTDNKLEKLFTRGGFAPQSGGGVITNMPQGGAVNDAGQFLFSLGVFGGRFKEAIYITK